MPICNWLLSAQVVLGSYQLHVTMSQILYSLSLREGRFAQDGRSCWKLAHVVVGSQLDL